MKPPNTIVLCIPENATVNPLRQEFVNNNLTSAGVFVSDSQLSVHTAGTEPEDQSDSFDHKCLDDASRKQG